MKNSKKIASVLMATALLAAAGISASAETITELNGTITTDVTGTYSDTSTKPYVYSVDVQWGAMKFDFSKSGEMTWNPESHSYTDNTSKTWTPSGNTITVVNHSNAHVQAVFSFDAEETLGDGVTATFDKNDFTLHDGDGVSYDEAYKNSSTLTLSGEPKAFDNDSKIGSVTVTIKEWK